MRLINWMNNTEKAKQIIEKIIYITLATCSKDGQSWNSPVFAFHDESSNFYWASWIKNQHSKKVIREAKAFMVDYPRRIYKAVPEKVWINGNGEVNGNDVDIRMEVSLLK